MPADPQPSGTIADSTRDPSSLRRALLDNYREGQGATASPAVYADLRAPWPYYEANYRAIVDGAPLTASVLEIGAGHGSLLAWLRSLGFSRLAGIDSSPGDVAFANAHLGGELVVEGDVLDYLEPRREGFDLIVAKAVVEHIPKPSLLAMVELSHDALRPGGILLVDVPNMDWIAAPHERYMDLTHEVGFTRQSLHSLLALRFDSTEIHGSRIASATRSQRLFRAALIRAIRRGLYVLGEGADDTLFESRSLIAVARRDGSR